MNTKTTIALCAAIVIHFAASAQNERADTVIVPLAESSKIIFTIQNRDDLRVLKHYNFQELFDDILQRLEEGDTLKTDSATVAASHETTEEWNSSSSDQNDRNEDNDEDDKWERSRHGRVGQTWQSTNVDFGTNNFLAEDQFPNGSETYAVRPWGSWYLGVTSVQRTRLGKNAFVEWGLGVSWYTFKFQEDNIRVEKDELGVHFIAESREVDYIKSKLGVTYINASLVPVLDFGDHSRKRRMWEGHGSGFSIGVGPYVGYRIGSRSKIVYEENGHREKDKDRDSFYLNNLRYGLRLQLGLRSTDLFVNYDMNELFAKDKGPRLNAISFGFVF